MQLWKEFCMLFTLTMPHTHKKKPFEGTEFISALFQISAILILLHWLLDVSSCWLYCFTLSALSISEQPSGKRDKSHSLMLELAVLPTLFKWQPGLGCFSHGRYLAWFCCSCLCVQDGSLTLPYIVHGVPAPLHCIWSTSVYFWPGCLDRGAATSYPLKT